MGRRGHLLLPGVVAAIAFTLVLSLSDASGSALCEPIVKQKPQGMYTQYCGPATAVASVHGKTYRFSHGNCRTRLDRTTRVFQVEVGYVQDSWTGVPTVHAVHLDVRPYTGPGTYSTNSRASIDVRVGKALWYTVPATSASKKLGNYRGGGTVTVRPGNAGGAFAAPVPDDLGSDTRTRDLPTVRITGSFACR